MTTKAAVITTQTCKKIVLRSELPLLLPEDGDDSSSPGDDVAAMETDRLQLLLLHAETRDVVW